ncbi:M48 family metallopeptidase [Dehalococcoidales bacterium]|nr:M48 family metallopeptidase [Dehalococcoidales bacterium]
MISREKFKKDVIALSGDVGVDVREVHIRKMKRKWASCSSSGRLTFDTSLLAQPDETRLRAVLHELLHLRYPNHSKMFKLMLETHLQKRGVSTEDRSEGEKN